MLLTHFFLRNRRFSLVALLFLLALGVGVMRTISLSEDPALEIPRFDVIAIAPGSGPLDVENRIALPLEDALRELESVKRVVSKISDGFVQTSVEFTFGCDPSKKYDEVARRVNAARTKLPANIVRLEVMRGETTNIAVMQLAVVSPDLSDEKMAYLADELRRRIEHVAGVKKAEVHAPPVQEARVSLKMKELAAAAVPLERITEAIRAVNSVIPAGVVESGNQRFNVNTGGAIGDLETLRNLPLAPHADGGGIVRLRDVADVVWQSEDAAVISRYNGTRAVFVTVMMREGADIFSVSDGVREDLSSFQKQLPSNASVEVGFDQSGNVARRMDGLKRDFVIALLLVLITLAPLGLRPSLIVMVSIPLCLALAVAALQWCGFNLNQLSIVGCVIALGLLVDDSIVVVENIARFRREGHGAVDAARLATRQIAVAVVGTTATLLFAFLPLLMLPEAAGLFIRSLPAAVVFAVLASLFVALSIVPWLASLLLSGRESSEGNVILRGLQKLISMLYRPALRWCMSHRVAALLLAVALCAGSLAFVPSIGFSLFPKAGLPQFLVRIHAAEGSSLAQTNVMAHKMEALLQSEPDVRSAFTTVGEGNPRVYYNVFPEGRSAGFASIFVCLDRFDEKTTPSLLERLREKAEAIPGARIELMEFENGPPVVAPVEVRVIGEDLAKAAEVASGVAALIRQTPGTRDVVNPVSVPLTDLEARFDEDKMNALGISKASARVAARLAITGLEGGKIRDSRGNERNIRLALPRSGIASLEAWDAAQVPLAAGGYVPLKEVARLESVESPPVIERRDHERVVTVTSHVQSGLNVERVAKTVREKLRDLKLPDGFWLAFGGEDESRAESFAGFGNAILLAVFGIVAILVLEFGTFRGTLIAASVIPLGIVGGLAGLWITGGSLSFTAMIGFIALIGIEIKNSILLVDFTNQLRHKGLPLDEAIAQAGEIRFLPVVLTTLTALGALLPLALQHSALYSPLAVVIIGGSLSSLLLSRLVTPVLYRLMPPRLVP